MNNFNYFNPVKILFGKGKINELSKEINANAKILITYGKGSIKSNGIYEQVKKHLAGFETYDFGGIEPNPTYETCMKALPIIKQKNIDFILAVGGGSVIDATKFIAAAAKYKGNNAWDIAAKGARVKDAIPFGSVLTLPATGSEMNANSVISKQETHEKLSFAATAVFPKFSILDPEYTYTLPIRQIANGITDAFIHVVEQYLTYQANTPIQDRFAEGIMLTLIEESKANLSTEPNYQSRANLMWAASMALNGLISCGVKTCWAIHAIGHEITALHGLDHAVTLAIVLPGLLSQKANDRKEKLLQFAERVWQIKEVSDEEKITKAIKNTELFFNDMGIKTRLSDYNIDKKTINTIVDRFTKRGYKYIGNQQDISIDEVGKILESRL